jgi:hypothetical protein
MRRSLVANILYMSLEKDRRKAARVATNATTDFWMPFLFDMSWQAWALEDQKKKDLNARIWAAARMRIFG